MSDDRERPKLRFSGPLSALSEADMRSIIDRSSTPDIGIRDAVSAIISRVQQDGDAALRMLARELDGVELSAIEVSSESIAAAAAAADPSFIAALKRAARNIEAVHQSLLPVASEIVVEPGVVVGRRPDPLQRVGVYAPGGRAAYPSSLLMGVIPAKVAGVEEVMVCSPPGPDGLPAQAVLAAAFVAGADRVFALGGAGAIAAMALGTKTVPRAVKVVGPGNAFVAEAKLQLAAFVAFDSPAGPSELLIIADQSADPSVIAREAVAQAEHDPRAIVLVVTIGENVRAEVERALASEISAASRTDIVRLSLSERGGTLSVPALADAIDIANAFAPEHLLLAIADPDDALSSIRNTGTVFLGETSSVAFGDYATGANHVLPTGGMARSYSGLSTLDFIRWTTYQRIDRSGAAALSDDVATLANAEGLHAHAEAARAWRGKRS